MKLSKMIKVMEHFKNGGEVECTEIDFDDWEKAKHPCWNWSEYKYRIKEPEQKITIEKWLCRDRQGDFLIFETSNVDKHKQLEKVKLIESYEVEL